MPETLCVIVKILEFLAGGIYHSEAHAVKAIEASAVSLSAAVAAVTATAAAKGAIAAVLTDGIIPAVRAAEGLCARVPHIVSLVVQFVFLLLV